MNSDMTLLNIALFISVILFAIRAGKLEKRIATMEKKLGIVKEKKKAATFTEKIKEMLIDE